MRKSIRWRIAIPYVSLLLLAIIALSIYFVGHFRRIHLDNVRLHLFRQAQLLAAQACRPGETDVLAGMARLSADYARFLETRVTVIRSDGQVIADSWHDVAQMDNHRYRPEISTALMQGSGFATRYSNTIGMDMLYVAVRIVEDKQPVGVLRLAAPMSELQSEVDQALDVVTIAGIIAGTGALVMAFYVANHTARPIVQLTAAAEQMARGDMSTRIWPTVQDEVGRLTQAFNRMASQIEEDMRERETIQERMGAVLDHMSGGVIITGNDRRVLLINPAASKLLETTPQEAMHRSFAQVVRHHQIVQLEERCQQTGQEQTQAIEISQSKQFLQVITTPLRSIEPPGVLTILRDLTEIRRLERVRRDFISNISHELRTPLASLKAILETLQDGALDDPPAAQRFLSLAENEIDALSQMVQELLELARIESGQVPLDIQSVDVLHIAVRPVELLQPQAERAGLTLDIELPDQMPLVRADPIRVQQVFTNLIHNAIKFTPPGGRIRVYANVRKHELLFAVQDTGVGIAPADLARIFERFYKADRSRSGGGTGLGLAISKHLVKAHGGAIWAKSTVGRGSTFFFTLPRADVDPQPAEGDQRVALLGP